MPRPQKVALQRCLLYSSVLRGVEDAAPYKRKLRFFDKLSHADAWLFSLSKNLFKRPRFLYNRKNQNTKYGHFCPAPVLRDSFSKFWELNCQIGFSPPPLPTLIIHDRTSYKSDLLLTLGNFFSQPYKTLLEFISKNCREVPFQISPYHHDNSVAHQKVSYVTQSRLCII